MSKIQITQTDKDRLEFRNLSQFSTLKIPPSLLFPKGGDGYFPLL